MKLALNVNWKWLNRNSLVLIGSTASCAHDNIRCGGGSRSAGRAGSGRSCGTISTTATAVLPAIPVLLHVGIDKGLDLLRIYLPGTTITDLKLK